MPRKRNYDHNEPHPSLHERQRGYTRFDDGDLFENQRLRGERMDHLQEQPGWDPWREGRGYGYRQHGSGPYSHERNRNYYEDRSRELHNLNRGRHEDRDTYHDSEHFRDYNPSDRNFYEREHSREPYRNDNRYREDNRGDFGRESDWQRDRRSRFSEDDRDRLAPHAAYYRYREDDRYDDDYYHNTDTPLDTHDQLVYGRRDHGYMSVDMSPEGSNGGWSGANRGGWADSYGFDF